MLMRLNNALYESTLNGCPSQPHRDAITAQRARVDAARQRVQQEGYENAPKIPAFLRKQTD
jgi:hypothetical protein